MVTSVKPEQLRKASLASFVTVAGNSMEANAVLFMNAWELIVCTDAGMVKLLKRVL